MKILTCKWDNEVIMDRFKETRSNIFRCNLFNLSLRVKFRLALRLSQDYILRNV